jgi:AraC-like DNA-binding protein
MDAVKYTKHHPPFNPKAAALPPPIDRLSGLLDRFRVRAHLFHAGALCGTTAFEAKPGRAFLHVLRRGELVVTHGNVKGLKRRVVVNEPTLMLYPRPVAHAFHNPPRDESDFTCATLDFDGAEHNPLVVALPALVLVPLDQVDGLQPALDLLFAETDRVRCGSRLLADRLFEVVLIQLLRWLIDHPGASGVGNGLIAGLADPRLARLLVALHAAPAEAWPLERMAAQAGMSRTAFAVAFKRATNATPAGYLADWRLTLAMSELRAGRLLKAVAESVGYGSATALSKAFKQRYGVAPRDWRRADQGQHDR